MHYIHYVLLGELLIFILAFPILNYFWPAYREQKLEQKADYNLGIILIINGIIFIAALIKMFLD